MTLGTEARKYMDMRDSLYDEEKGMINDMFRNLYENSKHWKVPAATDDRAAELEAAMIKFIIQSREE